MGAAAVLTRIRFKMKKAGFVAAFFVAERIPCRNPICVGGSRLL
jgi:hypothetical protein